MVELERVVVAVDDGDFLGAGKQPHIGSAGGSWRDGLRIGRVIDGLVGLETADRARGELRRYFGGGVGDQGRRPILVGDAEPGIGDAGSSFLSSISA